jgi:hypothetical protein
MKTLGKPRSLTDAQLQRILDWQPLNELAREVGVTSDWAHRLRKLQATRGWVYKTKHAYDVERETRV